MAGLCPSTIESIFLGVGLFVSLAGERRAGPTIGEPASAVGTSNRYPIDVRLGGESLGQLTIALSGSRATEHDAWFEGNPGPADEPVEPSWPAVDYEQKVTDAAIRALERARASTPRKSRSQHASLAE
jgi:hypothetical protein